MKTLEDDDLIDPFRFAFDLVRASKSSTGRAPLRGNHCVQRLREGRIKDADPPGNGLEAKVKRGWAGTA